jgi:peptidylprolyl isomerase
VTGMEEGEIRKLIVPPSLSKRKDYPDYLSPDSTLIYEIELVEITKIINQ